MRKGLAVSVDSWGNIIVSGPVDEGDALSHVFVAKLDHAGNVIWRRVLARDAALEDDDLDPTSLAPPPLPREAYAMQSYAPAASTPPARPSDHPSPEQLAPFSDVDVDSYQASLARQRQQGRWIGGAAIVACLATIGLGVGLAKATTMASEAERPAALLRDVGLETGLPRAQPGGAAIAEPSFASWQRLGGVSAPAHAAVEALVEDGGAEATPVAAATGAELRGAKAPASREPAKMPSHIGETFDVDGVGDLRSQALTMLEAGRADDAITPAAAYVAADGENAHSYLCLGAAYQALGRMVEAQVAYDACATFAKRGNVAECRALGGRVQPAEAP